MYSKMSLSYEHHLSYTHLHCSKLTTESSDTPTKMFIKQTEQFPARSQGFLEVSLFLVCVPHYSSQICMICDVTVAEEHVILTCQGRKKQ